MSKNIFYKSLERISNKVKEPDGHQTFQQVGLDVKRRWSRIFKTLKEKNVKPRVSHTTKLSL